MLKVVVHSTQHFIVSVYKIDWGGSFESGGRQSFYNFGKGTWSQANDVEKS